jgi:hypothetical protein
MLLRSARTHLHDKNLYIHECFRVIVDTRHSSLD